MDPIRRANSSGRLNHWESKADARHDSCGSRTRNAPRQRRARPRRDLCWSHRSLFCRHRPAGPRSPLCGFSGRSRRSPRPSRFSIACSGWSTWSRDPGPPQLSGIRDTVRSSSALCSRCSAHLWSSPSTPAAVVRRDADAKALPTFSRAYSAAGAFFSDAATDARRGRDGHPTPPTHPHPRFAGSAGSSFRPHLGCGCVGHRAHALPAVGTNSPKGLAWL